MFKLRLAKLTDSRHEVLLDMGDDGIVRCGVAVFKKVNNNTRLLVTFVSALIDEFEYTFSVAFNGDYKTELMNIISKNILMQLKFLEYRLEDLTIEDDYTII